MKNILFILFFLGAAIAILFYFEQGKNLQWNAFLSQGTGAPIYSTFNPSKVNEILIEVDTEKLVIRQDPAGVWRLIQRDDYPVNANLVADFLLRLQQGKISEKVTCPDSELYRLNLDLEACTRISLLGNSTLLYPPLRLGRMVLPEDVEHNPVAKLVGRYYTIEGTPNQHFFSTLTLENTHTTPAPWLDKNFIKIDDLKEVYFMSQKGGFSFSRQTRAEPFKSSDSSRISDDDADTASYYLNALVFDDVKKLPPYMPASIGSITTTSFSNEQVVLTLFKWEGRIWVKVKTYPVDNPRYEGYLFRAPAYMFKHFITP